MRLKTKSTVPVCALFGLLMGYLVIRSFAAEPPVIMDINFADDCDGMHLEIKHGKVKGMHTAADCGDLKLKVKGTSDGSTITIIEKLKVDDGFDIDGDGKNDTWRWTIREDHTYDIEIYDKKPNDISDKWTLWWKGSWN